jgi:Synergist-CTERM protein sorting domain-containing protein
MLGTTEDASTVFRQVQTMVPMYGSTGFQDMAWYTQQDEWPIMGTTADAGRFPVMFGQATVNANISNIILQWTNNSTTIGLRFPNVIDFTSESYGGSAISAANQWGSGSGTWPNLTDGAPTAIPALLYNQGRDAFVYKSYFAGMTSGYTANGQNLQLATWLVPPAGSTVANITALLDTANSLKDKYRINWGGWEYPDEKLSRPAVQKVALAGRWDAGIDIIRVDTRTGQTYSDANPNANAIQIITKGHIVRFWDKEYFSCRHIMIDFLSKIIIPSGFTAPWQSEMRKFIALYPFDNYRERKIWNGSTLVGSHLGRQMYVGTLSSVNALTPTFSTLISNDSSYVRAGVGHAAEAWTNRYTNASVAYENRGRNDENVSRISAGIALLYPACVTPDDNIYFNGLIHGTLIAPAVRNRLTELGLSGTIADTSNVTSANYVAANADAIWKAYNAYNNYYKKYGVPDSGYTGEIKEDRPEVYNGGTYANSFRLPIQGMNTANLDGRLIATGGWGGRGTLHSWNERVELDGMVDFVKRQARVFTEYASGVPHTWTISGAAVAPYTGLTYKGFAEKGKLEYAVSNDTRPGIYIQEEKVAMPIVMGLYAANKLSRDETVEILYARKFRKDVANFTLTTNLTNAAGSNTGRGKVYMFAKEGTTPDLTATWTKVAEGSAGSANFNFVDGSVYDQLSAANRVEVSVIALVVTNGYSVPLDISGEANEGKDSTIREHIKDEIRKDTGCNAGFAIFALAAIPFILRRRK